MQTYPTGYAESHRMAEKIFRDILPRHGMAVREEQIALCHEVLDTLYNKEISLCEAGVGTGKTLAYLVGCILWQMYRPERMKLPIVISTSSVALQDAILTEYLPDLSAILLDEGIITTPVTAVVRKGKERFVCDARLAERASLVHPKRTREKSSLRIAENILDMDHIPELSRYDRCRICVPQSCPRDCFLREDCRYQQYLRDSMKPDIQICNHNYLLADASHRLEDRPLLLRSYQALVVDEAHKLPDAARQMYTETLSPHNMDELCLLLQQAHYKDFARQLRTAFLTLSFSCTQGFSKLRGKASEPFVLTPFRRAALIDCIALLQNAGGLPDVPRYLLNRLGEAESLLRLFLLEVPTRILYIDYDADGQPTFCAASSRVPQLLRSALWNTREPAILTSGTLAAAGDFSHTEQLLGLAAYAPLRHFRADSPFNYKKKCLLYFPPRVKMQMDNRKMAEEIVRLVDACHGHALVLFTSYRQMAEVRALTDGQWQYPTYQAWRNGGRVIQQFKESGNGVLFAAGSCWEGIDFPGDMVSLLNQKGYAAQKQHIDIQFEVNDLSPLQIELIDCTVVLGNLLDNAIEACLKLEEAKRRIEVSVLRDEAYADGDAKLYVSIINTSLPVHIEKDCIATTKLEPHLHGFGLPCAKELLRRNNAFYTMDYHDGAFQFCFEWPDVACNSCVHA